eukprot:symbB.v1.2.036203.t1/scaffold5023.1/size31742/1
MILM